MIKKYSGFTLVEMLVVMGIIILLMAMGIGGGRLALQSASNITFKSGVKQMQEAALTHYSAKGGYPAGPTNPKTLLTGTGAFTGYVESFDGGNDTTYFYIVDTAKQSVLICVDLAADLAGKKDIYCEGNGFGKNMGLATTINAKTLVNGTAEWTALNAVRSSAGSNWVNKAWQ
jgi:type II secretory pathway pseudopilin PulG